MRIHRVSGMILTPRFYEIEPLRPRPARSGTRARWASIPRLPVGLVLFGGEGTAVMLEIARPLARSASSLLICGHNAQAPRQAGAAARARRVFVEGFTTEVPRYMHLPISSSASPGPGSISEAVAMRLPVIVERNAWTLPQERYNAEWVREQGVGMVLPNFRGIARAVDELLEPAAYQRFRAATAWRTARSSRFRRFWNG